MEEQEVEVDSVADLRVVFENDVGPDVVDNIGMEEVLLDEPEGKVLDEAEDLVDLDVGTPSRKADSVSATAGTSPGGAVSLLGSISCRIVPSWLGWPGWGTSRSDPVVASRTQQHSRGGSRYARSVDRVPDSSGIPAHPQMYETPQNNGAMSQGYVRQEGRLTARPGTLFGDPLEWDEEYRETASVNPAYTVPVLADHSYVGGNVVQVSGPDRSFSSGAGLVGAGQLVPVPAGEAGTAVASAGTSAVVPVQSNFPAGIQSAGMGHLVSTPAVGNVNIGGLVPDYSGRGGLVYSFSAPMVSAGVRVSVGDGQPASVPVDT